MAGSVMFYVQHLLGIGHVRRAAVLSRAMNAAGLEVTVVLGGMDVPGTDFGPVTLVRLAACRAADQSFSGLVDGQGRAVDDQWKVRRRQDLLTALENIRPDVLMFEAFPFGRRQFRFEILPLLEKAHALNPRPRIVSSVRDVLVQKAKPERNREMVETARAWFDAVLVHGDPRVAALADTLPEAALLSDLIQYTGYVVEPAGSTRGSTRGSAVGKGEVIVSVGGGAVGGPLLRCSLAARPLSRARDRTWRLLTGPNLSEKEFNEINKMSSDGVIIEESRPDFPDLLANCRVSISQGGYNTVMDVLKTEANAIIVPFAEGGETEQSFRARRLAKRGLIRLIEAQDLEPERLARTIDEAVDEAIDETVDEAIDKTGERRPAGSGKLDFSGASTTARIVVGLAGTKVKRPERWPHDR